MIFYFLNLKIEYHLYLYLYMNFLVDFFFFDKLKSVIFLFSKDFKSLIFFGFIQSLIFFSLSVSCLVKSSFLGVAFLAGGFLVVFFLALAAFFLPPFKFKYF